MMKQSLALGGLPCFGQPSLQPAFVRRSRDRRLMLRAFVERIPMATFDPNAIRVIREPTVYLVGRQLVDDAELDRFLADHGVSWQTDTEVAGEALAEISGRLCYLSYAKPRPGGNKTYLGHILEVGHGSVLEHAVWNFIFVGVSRSLTHELVRHRHLSYSQLSQRYVDESVAEYVEPDCIAV